MREIEFRGKIIDEPDEWALGNITDNKELLEKK